MVWWAPGSGEAQQAHGGRDSADVAVHERALDGAAEQPVQALVLVRPGHGEDGAAVAQELREAGAVPQGLQGVEIDVGRGGGHALGLALGDGLGGGQELARPRREPGRGRAKRQQAKILL